MAKKGKVLGPKFYFTHFYIWKFTSSIISLSKKNRSKDRNEKSYEKKNGVSTPSLKAGIRFGITIIISLMRSTNSIWLQKFVVR